MIALGIAQPTRYFRTSWMLRAESSLLIPSIGTIRFLPTNEAEKLSFEIRKRNVFARHSWENSFYLTRMNELAEKTILEVFLPGNPKEIQKQAAKQADLMEQLAVLSSTFYMKRDQLHHKLGLRTKPRAEFDFAIGPEFRYLTSKSKPEPDVDGITIDPRFCRRFTRLGFSTLAQFLNTKTAFQKRLNNSARWLVASRLETNLEAAVVKTSIALESLLIFNESESLARSLSERIAFILSSEPEIRVKLSKSIKDFYDVRSGIVHGNAKKLKELSSELLESVDRLCLLVYLVVAANPTILGSEEALQNWCNSQKWGYALGGMAIPYSSVYLGNAIQLAERQNSVIGRVII